MALSSPDVHAVLVHDYAEALVALIRRTARRFPTAVNASITQPLDHYTRVLTERLELGTSQPADGCSRAALTDAWQALQQLGYHVERAARAQLLARHRQALLAQLHVATMEAIAAALTGHDPSHASTVPRVLAWNHLRQAADLTESVRPRPDPVTSSMLDVLKETLP